MKVLLAFPPQWTPISPHFAIPSLSGQLKRAGFEVFVSDLNIDFYDTVLKSSFILNSASLAVSAQDELLKEIAQYHSPDKDFSDYPLDIQNKMVRYSKVKEYITKKADDFVNIPKFIKDARMAIKDKDVFYKPEILIKSMSVIDEALEIASLPYYPSKISLDTYSNPFFRLNFDSIKYFVFDKNTNIFIDFYKSKIEEIKKIGAKYIGISINSSSQIVAGLTLANMLKNNTDAHVNIGGNFFGRVVDEVVKRKEFFDLFCHSLLVEEGELPVVELGRYIRGDIAIEEVSNLVYPIGDEIKINEKKPPMKLDEMANVSLDGYDFKKYFAPEIILPFQSSRGCYWGKCSFCDQGFGQNFNVKNPDKLINEFREIKEKYGIDKFEFIDESVGPAYLKEFADKLDKSDVEVNYFMDARLERAFDFDTLKKAHKNGLKMILWGLESGSEKIMELINKGIDIDKRLDILRDSSNAGIWNFAFIFFGFPAETKEDAQQTIDMIVENKDIVHSYGRSVFTMGKHTRLRENPEKYGIVKIYPNQDEFMPSYTFDSSGMKNEELAQILKDCTNTCYKAYNNPLWMYLRYREYLFLYLCKYSQKELSEYKLKL